MPDGFRVAVAVRAPTGEVVEASAPRLSAQGAQVRPLGVEPPLWLFELIPLPGAREATVRAVDGALSAEARFAVGPPAARVELTLDPPRPVKGRDSSAALTVKVLRPDGAADPSSPAPVLRANVGELEALQQAGPGQYRAQYRLPTTRYPEVAIVAAFAPWPHPGSIHGAFGNLLVPLASAIELPGRTEPNAKLTLEIAGNTYGPVDAGPDGRFKLPVVVPPGHRFGRGTAIDAVGNKRVRRMDLMLPPTDQLACVANPPKLLADGAAQARVLCAASDPFGKPLARAQVGLKASQGRIGAPRPLGGGMLEWIYTAPRTAGEAADALVATAQIGRAKSREEMRVELVQGPPAHVYWTLDHEPVHYGGEGHVQLAVTDVFDRFRAMARLALAASVGTFSAPVERAPGRFDAVWRLPDGGGAVQAELSATAQGPAGTSPARLTAWVDRGQLWAAVVDAAGLPVPGQRIIALGEEKVTGPEGGAAIGPARSRPQPIELRHASWPGIAMAVRLFDHSSGQAGAPGAGRVQGIYPRGGPPQARSVKVVKLAPAVPVNVRVEVSGNTVTFWVEDAAGKLLPGRAVEVSLSAGRRGELRPEGSKTSFSVFADAPITASIADIETGVTALAEVKP